jgi:hypothetical protein
MKRFWGVLLAAVGVLSNGGCGSNSCQDACNAVVACTNKFAPGQTAVTGQGCTNSCNASTCSTKQTLIDCLHGASCNGTGVEYASAVNACVSANPGCFTITLPTLGQTP